MAYEELRRPYEAMHAILQRLRNHDLQPALDWVSEHRDRLAPDGRPSSFEFKLHSLGFVTTLREQGVGHGPQCD